MSDISISTDTMSSMALESQISGAESINTNTIMSGANQHGLDSLEQTVAGAEVASRTTEFFGSGTDLSSTGTDIDVAQAINTSLMDGTGSITDKIV